MSLYVFNRDTLKEKQIREKRLKSSEDKKPGLLNSIFKNKDKDVSKEKKYKPVIAWEKKEIDYGSFHSELSWAPTNDLVAYSKYRYGKYQSLVYDIKVYDQKYNTAKWITNSKRATYPSWSPDGQKLVYVAHNNSIANLYEVEVDKWDQEHKQLTNYTYDTQILSPKYSPDGSIISFLDFR